MVLFVFCLCLLQTTARAETSLYRYVTRTNVPFFDLNARLGLGSKNETFVRVTYNDITRN